MIKKILGLRTFCADQKLHPDVVVVYDDTDGKILSIDNSSDHDVASVRCVSGMITPGFINTHCHLELSHMKDVAPTGTGLLPFLHTVVSKRDIPQEQIDQAIIDADLEMYNNGIVACGDISNKSDTAAVKSKSRISYYTFVEMFDFLQPSMTAATIDQYRLVMKAQSDHGHNRKSYVPHAPYTVSSGLFDFINRHNAAGTTISIHNQEVAHENELFLTGTGGFKDFFTGFGMSMDDWKPINKTSIHYTIAHLAPHFRTLLVHNTMSTRQDVELAYAWNKDIYWATCPNANLYIENRLPDYKVFLDTGAQVTIGTDSLTSNWQLSIWEEIRTILRYQSYLTLETVLTWATINGARALQYDDRLGSIEIGKQPGLIHILDQKVERII
jgi:aminodeoxyfutalosine deaminase